MSDVGASDPHEVTLRIADEDAGERLDKALARAASDVPGLSRSRIAQLIDAGALADPGGATVTDAKRKVKAGEVWHLTLPPPAPARPEPEAIPLNIVHEDAHLIVVDKPAGMVVHPAPGAETGTLVNALLYHCGPEFSGIGGEARPGIVHRIDKDTSGLLVVAKSQAAHAGLSDLFKRHAIDRVYTALVWGAPDRADPRLAGLPGVSREQGGLRIGTRIGRHPADRKRMAVLRRDTEGREAVTHIRSIEPLGPASRITCELETGRTHQIRVHLNHLGHPLIGDAVYGRSKARSPVTNVADITELCSAFPRQALHAGLLGFQHPIFCEELRFEAPLPPDMAELLTGLRRSSHSES